MLLKRFTLGRLSAAVILFSGCSSAAGVIPEPGKISLEEALASVGRGLVMMKQEQLKEAGKAPLKGSDFSTGLVPADVEVTFNITASGKDDNRLYVELTPLPASGTLVAGKAGVEAGNTYSAGRGNQINIRFQTLLFSKKTTTKDGTVIVEGPTDPDFLDKFIKAAEKNKVTYFSTPLDLKVEKSELKR